MWLKLGLAFGKGDVSVKRFLTCVSGRLFADWMRVLFGPSCYHCRLRLRSFGCMLRSVVSAIGRQHDAGSMQLRCAHLIGVLDVGRQQSGARHHRNHVPGGPRRPAVRQLTAGNAIFQAAWGTVRSNRKSTSSTHVRCRMTLIRLASATMARLPPRRRATCAAQVLSHVERTRCIMTVAA